MKYKRILAGAFALALTLPLLLPWAYAHPGRTDKNGGHTDTGTGDYHYHHGHDAHAHFDIDGNGTIDCPYDFVDATNHSSGTRSSGSYTPGDGSEDGYQEGYEDGYKEGKLVGTNAGYAEGYSKGVIETEKEYRSQLRELEGSLVDWQTYSLWVCGLLIFFLAVTIWLSLWKQKKIETNFKYHSEAKQSEYTTQTNLNKAMHEAKIRQMEAEHKAHTDSLIADHQRRLKVMATDHAAEVRYLKRRLINFKRLEVLEQIAQGKDDSIRLPEGVALRPSYTPIRGKTTKHYPYGSYTVFLAVLGKTYHCKHDCAPSARPAHFFDLPKEVTPCRKCVPFDMYPQSLPDWYIQLREKLNSIVSVDCESAQPPDRTQHADEPQIQFSLK